MLTTKTMNYISKEEALISISGEREKGIFKAIHVCNSDYQQAIQQMCNDFISLKRINKSDVVRILSSYADINLGEDINPYLLDKQRFDMLLEDIFGLYPNLDINTLNE